ncbi:MAG: ribonuclease H [bacterium]
MPKETNEKEKVLIFADGASKGNPGRGGWGALISGNGEVVELGGAEAHTTNNRMELTAALSALEYVGGRVVRAVVVHTDSSYVINGITKWVAGWQRSGWLTKEKKPVLNRDLWEKLAATVESLKNSGAKISWQHVGGHVGVAGNERVDEIASSFAEGAPSKLFTGKRSDYTHEIENISHNPEKASGKTANKTHSRAKAYSYVSMVDGTVVTHKTWGECEARVKGKMARFKKATSPSEEAAIIKEFS